MSSFTTPLLVEVIGKNRFKLASSFEYHVGIYPNDDLTQIIKVPKGFDTDFASVPRIFWAILSPIDEYAKAAVIHDYCYRHGLFKKSKCDKIFKEAMEVLNVPKWKIFVIYWSVYLFAWFIWCGLRKRQYKETRIKHVY